MPAGSNFRGDPTTPIAPESPGLSVGGQLSVTDIYGVGLIVAAFPDRIHLASRPRSLLVDALVDTPARLPRQSPDMRS